MFHNMEVKLQLKNDCKLPKQKENIKEIFCMENVLAEKQNHKRIKKKENN